MTSSPPNWDFEIDCLDADSIDESQCGVSSGEIFTSSSGQVACSVCLLVIDIESDLESGQQIGDQYSQADDDDDDGNADNPEFNNAQDVISDIGVNWSPELTFKNEITDKFFSIAKILQEQEDDVSKGYAALIYANLDSLVPLYMFYSHHGTGPNIFKKNLSRRQRRCLAIISVFRQERGMIFDESNLIESVGEDYRAVSTITKSLINSRNPIRKNQVRHYIKAIAGNMKVPSQSIKESLELWERDEEMGLAATPQTLALGWICAYLEVFQEDKRSISGLSRLLRISRATVSKVKKEYQKTLQTIMTAL